MPAFTIETTYHLPVFRQRTYQADTVADACQLAIEDSDWEDGKEDVDTSGETFVTGVWSGANAAYRTEALEVPSRFDETAQRKADHFDVLLSLLEEPARVMGLSPADFSRWLPRATAAIAKAEAILAGEEDPN